MVVIDYKFPPPCNRRETKFGKKKIYIFCKKNELRIYHVLIVHVEASYQIGAYILYANVLIHVSIAMITLPYFFVNKAQRSSWFRIIAIVGAAPNGNAADPVRSTVNPI